MSPRARAKLQGTVIRGAGLGRKLGIPTANIRVRSSRKLPWGVFKVFVRGSGLGPGRVGVCNVGTRPTVTGSKARHVEVHIPGFKGNLYGKTLKLLFLDKIRDEKRFATLGALKAQIRRDIRKSQEL